MPLLTRWGLQLVYLMSMLWLVKRVVLRCCPECHHVMWRHQRRRDGSFMD